MANCCFYELAACGFKSADDKNTVLNIFRKNYGTDVLDEDTSSFRISGECKWTMDYAFLTEGVPAYLPDLSAKYNIAFEAYAECCGAELQEHVVVVDGEIERYETERYLDMDTCETYSAFCEVYDKEDRDLANIHCKADWEKADKEFSHIEAGGFNWIFTINTPAA